MADRKRSEQIQREINRLTSEQEEAIKHCNRLEASTNDHANRMHDCDLTDAERKAAEAEYRRMLAEFSVQRDYVATFNEPLERKRKELAAALEAEWKAARLKEIADGERQAEKAVIGAEAEWDQPINVAGGFPPRLIRMLLEIGRIFGVNDPLGVLGGTAQNIFERSALYSNLQSVDEEEKLGRLSILRIPGAKSHREESGASGPITLADHLRGVFAGWAAAARREVEMPRSDRESGAARKLFQPVD